MALVGTPASSLVDLAASGVCKASESAPNPPGPNLQAPGDVRLPLLRETSQREPFIHSPMMQTFPKKDDPILQVACIPPGPIEAIASPSGTSMLPKGLPRGPPLPHHQPVTS